MEFIGFPKIARFSREIIITEKIDGTNAQIYNGPDDEFLVGSRTKWITPDNDNYGFAAWAYEHKEELRKLGPGHHFGEWWGRKIQRGYNLQERKFSLFNTSKWNGTVNPPSCCNIVPVLYRGPMTVSSVSLALSALVTHGSFAAPGFTDPEGIVIYHTAANIMFKKTLKNDEKPKGEVNE